MKFKLKDMTKWRPWFAWHPVQIERRQLAWGCYVDRRGVPAYDGIAPFLEWEYREPRQEGLGGR